MQPSGCAAVVKAWAPWCGSCRALAPVVDRVAETAGVTVVSLQVDADPELADRLRLRSVPTLVAFSHGVETGRLVGIQSEAAVASLFALAAADEGDGDGGRLVRRAPTSLVAARTLAGLALLGAGVVSGSIVLGVTGAGALAWAASGLLRR